MAGYFQHRAMSEISPLQLAVPQGAPLAVLLKGNLENWLYVRPGHRLISENAWRSTGRSCHEEGQSKWHTPATVRVSPSHG